MNMSERPPPNSICPVRSGQSNSIAAPRHSAKASVWSSAKERVGPALGEAALGGVATVALAEGIGEK